MHNRSWVSLVVGTALCSLFLGSAVFFVVSLALVWRLTFGVVVSAVDWVSVVRIPRPVKFFREKQRAAVAASSATTTLALELLPSWSEGAAGKRQGKPCKNQQACQPRRQTSSAAPASSTGTLVERAASDRRTHRQSRALAFLHSFMIVVLCCTMLVAAPLLIAFARGLRVFGKALRLPRSCLRLASRAATGAVRAASQALKKAAGSFHEEKEEGASSSGAALTADDAGEEGGAGGAVPLGEQSKEEEMAGKEDDVDCSEDSTLGSSQAVLRGLLWRSAASKRWMSLLLIILLYFAVLGSMYMY
ncbi:uncharacterized protein LOC119598260 [Penaeus monodon]|uniref:uncharacterized protein LOC119598260 n=1 Tax=Penaeus monodon TaxID=6687 RepID=UPI0018A76643|nr:uncharacterized protein LOC119598260 [Penaeus monodon]